MELVLKTCVVRPWRMSDASSMARHADCREVARNLRDRFPHPYTVADAERYLSQATREDPPTAFAIEVDGQAVGSVAFTLGTDVERISAEVGYWLGQDFWNRGVLTEALVALRDHAITTYGLTRIFALPFDFNPASSRVLEKAGFVLEGRLRRAAIKDGRVIDHLMYAYVTENDPPGP